MHISMHMHTVHQLSLLTFTYNIYFINFVCNFSSSSEEEYETIEKQRQKDLKERDEFSERLKKKDQDKTRNIVSKAGKSKLF